MTEQEIKDSIISVANNLTTYPALMDIVRSCRSKKDAYKTGVINACLDIRQALLETKDKVD